MAAAGASAAPDASDSVLYIVRHGDRFDRETGGWDGKVRWEDACAESASSHGSSAAINSHDPPLSAQGQRQAAELGAFLAAARPNNPAVRRLLVSPYVRTIQTAAPLSAALDLKICLEDGLAEGTPTRGGLDGVPTAPQRFAYFPQVDLSYQPLCPVPRDRAEPYPEEFFARVIRAALAIERTCQAGEAAVLVSHAATVVGVTAALLRRPAAEVAPAAAASVFELRRSARAGGSGGWQMHRESDTSYLRPVSVSRSTVPWGYHDKPDHASLCLPPYSCQC